MTDWMLLLAAEVALAVAMVIFCFLLVRDPDD